MYFFVYAAFMTNISYDIDSCHAVVEYKGSNFITQIWQLMLQKN